MKIRCWTYDRGTWRAPPDWPRYARWLPVMGWDEYDYRTLVLPIPFAGQFVVAWRWR